MEDPKYPKPKKKTSKTPERTKNKILGNSKEKMKTGPENQEITKPRNCSKKPR